MMKVNFTDWNHVCAKCSSNRVQEAMHIDYPWQPIGYYCEECDDLYIFEDVRRASEDILNKVQMHHAFQTKKEPPLR